MKGTIFSALLLGFMTVACGGGESTPGGDKQNTAPSVPTLVAPLNNTLCIDNSVNFEWSASVDPENNPITYQIQIATDNQFTQITQTLESYSIGKTVVLNKGIAYYWRVKAVDSKNAGSNYSATYSFYTEASAISNHLPFLPEILMPESNSAVAASQVNFKWFATDVDGQDTLVYDVYLSTTNPPNTKIGSSISTSSYSVNTLQNGTDYYWKIVVKDNRGGETVGPVWHFRTN